VVAVAEKTRKPSSRVVQSKKIILTPEQAQRFLACFWEEALEIAAKRIAEREGKKTSSK